MSQGGSHPKVRYRYSHQFFAAQDTNVRCVYVMKEVADILLFVQTRGLTIVVKNNNSGGSITPF